MYGLETVNLGRSGATTKSWYDYYTDEEYSEQREPLWYGYDSALIRIGNNDYTYVSDDGGNTIKPGMTIQDGTDISIEYITKIITKLKECNPGIRIFLCTLAKSNSTDRLAQFRVPLMEAYRTIAQNDESVFLVDTNHYSNYQTAGGYYAGHPTAIGYQAIAQDIGNIIGYIIKTQNEKFKWIRWIGTEWAVTDGETPGPDEPDVG